jgi:phosphoglycerate dehydrogenase-like enzyme
MRALVEPRVPEWVEARWWGSPDELVALAPQAEIGWFDLHEKPPVLAAVEGAKGLRWLNTAYAGVNWLPLADLDRRGVVLTCGRGLTATSVAEFALMTMLAVAKDYAAVVRAQDRGEWLHDAPGTRELAGSRALVLGQGAIGQAVGRMLQGFGVETLAVRRSSGEGWRARLGEFDWIVLALPGTPETRGLIGAAELAAMKREAVLVNFARANIVDEAALIDALGGRRIAAAVLDVTEPEPLPDGHPLWSLPNVLVSPHVAGDSPGSTRRAYELAGAQIRRFAAGEPLHNVVDRYLLD